jgi:tetratricopeptide (TPR) repeat protein
MDNECLEPERDQHFSEVLVACLEAADNHAPAAIQQLIALHPEYAGELARFLEGQQRVDRVAGPLRDLQAELSARSGVRPDEQLGDYRILREVGRGGMGVVYEAVQLSLERRVALKVLPFAATLDARQLQRFENEAHAAAQLHHTSIVPVHAVGCERGVHYYAMQFIDGQTVAALIAELRQTPGPKEFAPIESRGPHAPPLGGETAALEALSTVHSTCPPTFFRTVAELGRQAAEALEHAHQHGVIHRDVKPANLLVENASPLSPPGTGVGSEGLRLWITDFGLAHCQSHASLTMTGDLVGTLRYMSPEQALAQREVVDHRTDVYSLGATLYELLTLQSVFAGTDRQELLRQIAFEEPRPPRRFNRAIPAELETIVLRALEKLPGDRYATARDMADDLRRFLLDEPIRAKRPTLLQRARRWGRRHRAVAWAAAAGVVATVIVLAGSIGWFVAERTLRRDRAVEEAKLAQADVTQLHREGKWRPALALVERVQTLLAHSGAEPALLGQFTELSRDLQMAADLEEIRLRKSDHAKDDHFDSERVAAEYAAAFRDFGIDVETLEPDEAANRIEARAIVEELAAALDDWASISQPRTGPDTKRLWAVARLADPDPLRNRFREALQNQDSKVLEGLAAAKTDDLPPSTIRLLAIALWQTGAKESAVTVLRKGQRLHPDDLWINHELAVRLVGLQPPRLEGAVRFYTAALTLRPRSHAILLNLGAALKQKGKVDEAVACFHRAIAIDTRYFASHRCLGDALADKGKLDEAIACYNRAIDLNPRYATTHYNLGNALRAKGKPDEAIACYREAIAIDPKFLYALNSLGVALKQKGNVDEAIACFHKAIAVNPRYGFARNNLGNALRAKGKVDEAMACFERAIAIDPRDATAHNNVGTILCDVERDYERAIARFEMAIAIEPGFAEAHVNRGTALRATGKVDEAIRCFRNAIELDPKYARAYYALGHALQAKNVLVEAEAAYRKASTLDPEYAEAHCNLGLLLQQQGRFADALAALKRGDELGSRRPGWPYPSAWWVRQAQKLEYLDARLPEFLSGRAHPAGTDEKIALALLCQQHRERYSAAARFYAGAFADQPELADELGPAHRYNAACSAALAGCGQGKDADKLDERERARLRRQAYDWLRADLALWRKQVEDNQANNGSAVLTTMQHWLRDTDLIGVREPSALTRLPAMERLLWQALWARVAETFAQAEGKVSPNRKK